MAIDPKFHTKLAELLERLVAEPSADELGRLQLHVDVLEKWRKLGETHSHDDDNNNNTHTHHDHNTD
jgi:hypothetical protein